MKKVLLSYASLLIILVFIGYMVYDSVRPASRETEKMSPDEMIISEAWDVVNVFPVREGVLKAVAVSATGNIYAGGDSFVSCYSADLKNKIWQISADSAITALSSCGDTLYATTREQVLLIGSDGRILSQWGPYEKNSMFTSVSAGKTEVLVADAGNRIIYMLDKGGEVKGMAGNGEHQFVVPSPYFDVVLNNDNSFSVANTGQRRIEKWSNSGKVESYFGEPGLAPEAFCGCCNPAHFTSFPGGFITAEKGINRIKILDNAGNFVEFVSSENDFVPSVPLDLASVDGKTIFAANPSDSKIYVFKRKKAKEESKSVN